MDEGQAGQDAVAELLLDKVEGEAKTEAKTIEEAEADAKRE